MHSQLLYIGSSAKALIKNYGGRTKEGWQTGTTPAHPRVSLSRPTATGGNEELTHRTIPQTE